MIDRALIINADDYGWDRSANDAILELAVDRCISSTTIMANCVHESDLREIRNIPGISTGLHLNLLDDTPVSAASRVASLLDGEGRFHSQKSLLLRSLGGRIRLDELEIEISNQLALLKKHHISVSHVDSHKHVHQYPVIGPAIMRILRRLGIKKLRSCNVSDWSHRKMLMVKLFSLATARSLHGYVTPDVLIPAFSIAAEADMPAFTNALTRAVSKSRVMEFMTHPARENRQGSYLNRVSEYVFWKNSDWRSWLGANKVQLISFNEL